VYVGTRYQRGHGLGSIFGSLFKSAVPLFKRGANTLGREALKTGLNLASEVMEGQNVTQAAKSRLKSTGQNLLQKAMDTGLQTNPIPISYIRKSFGVLESFLTEDVF
jgi:hypothetical protein